MIMTSLAGTRVATEMCCFNLPDEFTVMVSLIESSTRGEGNISEGVTDTRHRSGVGGKGAVVESPEIWSTKYNESEVIKLHVECIHIGP